MIEANEQMRIGMLKHKNKKFYRQLCNKMIQSPCKSLANARERNTMKKIQAFRTNSVRHLSVPTP